MKILFLVSDANCKGGTEILAYNLLHELNRKGLECKLLSRWVYTGDDPDVISLPEKECQVYKKLNDNPLNKLLGYVISDAYLKKVLARIIKDGGYDWIINHTYDLCAAIPQVKGCKTAQIFNWSIPGYESMVSCNMRVKGRLRSLLPLFGFGILKSRWHKALAGLDKLVMLTDAAHGEVAKYRNPHVTNQIITIPDPLMQQVGSRHVSSLKNKSVAFVGRLSYEKGVMRLLRIWKRIHASIPDFELKVYGDGPCKEEMKSWLGMKGEGLVDSVKFMGFCQDLETIYTNNDLCLMTSDTEGFGMVLIEAMYYGVPCITFDCPVSPKEIISDAGVAVACFDEDLYANEVVQLLQDESRMIQLQENAIKRASNYYIDNVTNMWLKMTSE